MPCRLDDDTRTSGERVEWRGEGSWLIAGCEKGRAE